MLTKFILVVILSVASSLPVAAEAVLTKKYTLRVLYGAPVTSRIVPMGKICANAAELVIDRVNSQLEVLPNYNVITDIYNDKCDPAITVKRTLDIFQRTANNSSKPSNKPFGDFILPANASFLHKSAEIALVPPITNGPFCSRTCPPYSRLATHFNRINVQALCMDMQIDKKWARNTFRYFTGNIDFRLPRSLLLKLHGWSKVAMLSTTDHYSYSTTRWTMEVLQKNNITIIAEEFILDDPRPPLRRLKAAGARVIFATCYQTNCPKVGCAIAEEGFYGPSVVWIFGALAEFINPPRMFVPKNCNMRKLKDFAQTVIRVKHMRRDKGVNVTELGVTVDELVEHSLSLPARETRSPLYQYLDTCFDHFQSTIYIMDAVEKHLNKGNKTLAQYLSGTAEEQSELLKLFRNAAQNLDIQGFLGRSLLEAGSKRPVGNKILIDQHTETIARVVAYYDLQTDEMIKFSDIKWQTKDGSTPKDGPDRVTIYPTVPFWLINVVRAVVIAIFIAYLATIVVVLRFKKHERLVNTLVRLKLVAMMGMLLILAVILIYPGNQDFSTFCMLAPGFLIMGYSLMIGSFVFGLMTPYFFPVQGRISEHPRVEAVVTIIVAACSIANGGLVVGWYFNAGSEFVEIIEEVNLGSTELWKTEVITTSIWPKCKIKDDYYFGMTLLGLQGTISLIGILAALVSKYHKHFKRIISDIAAARMCIYAVFPVSLAHVMAYFTLVGYPVTFGILVSYSVFISIGLLAFYARYLIKYDHTYIVVRSNRTTRVSAARSRRSAWK